MMSWTRVWKGILIDLVKMAVYCGALLLASEGHRRYSFAYGLLLTTVVMISAQATNHYLQGLKGKWQGPPQPLPPAKDATAEPATKY
ncbi:unnamed protein product [Linum tenue]|uniref:DUF2892 domain-containing protein n=1 Tax=Linum tenue TaxID=586396 RepID=A0AAV0HAU2_9ROSI|nr:unnamed protein product [Linum tenue]